MKTTAPKHPSVRRVALLLLALATLNPQLSTGFAQGTTAFTYHGRLTDGAAPANGDHLIYFAVFTTNYGGSLLFGITNTVPVSNGLFTVSLDFGGGIFDGAPRWLELGVSTNGPTVFTTLQPRQQFLPTPYAILASTAASVSSGAISASHIASGQVVKSLNGLTDDVTLLAGTNITLTAFPNSNLMISASSGDSVWSLNGSSAYYNGGNIGIGTASPAYTLDVAGQVRAAGAYLAPWGPILTVPAGPSSNLLTMRWDGINGDRVDLEVPGATANNALFSFTSAGRLGIGTAIPSSKLQVAFNAISDGILLENTAAGGRRWGLGVTAAGGPIPAGSLYLQDQTANAVRLTVATNGNVGIGTTGPSQKLDVNGAIRATGGATASSGSGVEIAYGDLGNVGRIFAFNRDSASFLDFGIGNFTQNKGIMVKENGNVGIGTTSPSAPLHIANRPQSYARIVSTNTQNGSVLDLLNTTPYGPDLPDPTFGAINFSDGVNFPGQIAYNVGTGMSFRSGGVPAMNIGLGAYVGIGRTAAANNLEVEGSASKSVAGSWLANSDARIKRDVESVSGALDRLERVRLVRFHYTDEYRRTHPGVENREYLNVIAQEFREVFPDHVKRSGEKLPDGSEILQVDAYPLTIYSAAAIQELNQKLEAQRAELKEKQTELTELKESMVELKALVKMMNAKLNGGAK